jgi:histidinol-phosphate aminotransferase
MNPISRRSILQSAGALWLGSGLRFANAAEARPRAVARLNHNENPFGPCDRARQALSNLEDVSWMYPFEQVPALRSMLAEHEGVRPENIYVSEGSGEVLKLAAIIYGEPGREVIAARPTFPMLPQYAERRGATVTWVDVNDRFDHDLAAMQAKVRDATSLIYICNPNNPTGTLTADGELRAFIHELSRRALIVVDEAYIDFAPEPRKASVIDLVKSGENVLVTRTFSKLYGLAGLRIGYGIGKVETIRRLESLRMSMPNQAGLAAARASLGDAAFYAEARKRAGECVKFVRGVFEELGIRYVPTHANFMMFDTRSESSDFLEFARERHVLIAPVGEPFSSWARVSMGRPEDMQSFANALRAFVRKV